MFWKVVRWGGTAALVAICGFALVMEAGAGSSQPSADPQAPAAQPDKKFNL